MTYLGQGVGVLVVEATGPLQVVEPHPVVESRHLGASLLSHKDVLKPARVGECQLGGAAVEREPELFQSLSHLYSADLP